MANKPTVFEAGIPIEPDVKKLKYAFPELKPGDVIPYAKISSLIGVQRTDNRWRTVVSSWRRFLFTDLHIQLVAQNSSEFVVADDSRKIAVSTGMVASANRKYRKAGILAQVTDSANLTDDERKAKDHIIRISAAMRLAAATAPKQLSE